MFVPPLSSVLPGVFARGINTAVDEFSHIMRYLARRRASAVITNTTAGTGYIPTGPDSSAPYSIADELMSADATLLRDALEGFLSRVRSLCTCFLAIGL